MRDHVVIKQAGHLIDEEGMPGGAFVPCARAVLKPPRQFLPPAVKRFAQQRDDVLARFLAGFLPLLCDSLGKRTPVDDGALFRYALVDQAAATLSA